MDQGTQAWCAVLGVMVIGGLTALYYRWIDMKQEKQRKQRKKKNVPE
jgi:hypothetical protein